MSTELFPTDGWIAEYRDALNSDALVQSLAQPAEFTSLIKIGSNELLLDVDQGDIELEKDPTVADPWDFAVKGGTEAWEQFALGDRDPEYHQYDIPGANVRLRRDGKLHEIRGDYRKLFAHMELLYEAFELMQDVGGD